MFCLWLWRFKWTGQNANFSVFDFLLHLRMREVFVDNDTLNEFWILNSTTCLSNNLNQIEIDIFSFEVCNVEYWLDSEVSKVVLALANNLRAESSCRALAEEFVIIFGDIEFFLYLTDFIYCNFTGLFETICNLQWVNTLVKKFLCLF